MCHQTLQSGGNFSFAIVPEYKKDGERLQISEDMNKVAQKYFKKEKMIRISWSGFYSDEANVCEKRKQVFDDVHIYMKED